MGLRQKCASTRPRAFLYFFFPLGGFFKSQICDVSEKILKVTLKDFVDKDASTSLHLPVAFFFFSFDVYCCTAIELNLNTNHPVNYHTNTQHVVLAHRVVRQTETEGKCRLVVFF